MHDLNDLYFFAQVVEHNGFAAAARVLGMPRSRLSRRIGLLEDRLGVRLLQRSTRRFAVTEIGLEYYRHCVAMLVEAEAAQDAIERARAEPQGNRAVKLPVIGALFSGRRDGGAIHGRRARTSQVHLESTSIGRVDVIREGFDIAIRVRFPPLEESDLVMKVLAESTQRLVASPRHHEGPIPDRLCPPISARFPALGWGPPQQKKTTARVLDGPNGSDGPNSSPTSLDNRGHGYPAARGPARRGRGAIADHDGDKRSFRRNIDRRVARMVPSGGHHPCHLPVAPGSASLSACAARFSGSRICDPEPSGDSSHPELIAPAPGVKYRRRGRNVPE